MDFRRFFYRLKKRIKKRFKKIKRFFKRYIRVLVRHTKAKDYSVLIYTIVFWLIVILLFSCIFRSCKKKKNDDKQNITTEMATVSDISTEQPDPAVLLAEEAKNIYTTEVASLLLVNSSHPLSAEYTFNHHTLNCGLDIDVLMHEDLVNMLNACNAAGFEYTIYSAYRNAESTQPKDDAGDATSEHMTGLAVDVAAHDVQALNEELANDTTCQWLQANCYNYGFVVRYPADKAEKTGVSYQPWHFRYVGKNAAIFMHNNNLSLEEFYELLGQ